MIPYGKHSINEGDIDAVVDVLKSDFLTQGPCVPKFEQVFCEYVNAQYAVAVNSATSALHIACLALGVKQGDVVWTTPISFVASANCALYCGARVDFVDVDSCTANMSPIALQQKITDTLSLGGALPKVLVVVHMAGNPCDMHAISEITSQHDIKVIEDASHAVGASFEGEPVGHGRYSDITVFSFHPVKIITSGEGGMAVTNCQELHEKMVGLSSHGVTKDPAKMVNNHGDWYYEQQELGFNYRLTDIQAALGLSQLARANEFVEQRRIIAKHYQKALASLSIKLPLVAESANPSWHLFIIQLAEGYDRKTIFNQLREMGIGVHVHYIPIYKQPYYQQLGFSLTYCEQAEHYYRHALSIPLYHGMPESEQSSVIDALHEVLL